MKVHTLKHQYFSTACWHENHERCRKECKFCEAKCICPCHRPEKAEVLPLPPKEAA
jgi:hypothetical protein